MRYNYLIAHCNTRTQFTLNESVQSSKLHLSTVHSRTLALNICHLHYFPTLQNASFALPPSIFSPYLLSTLLSPLVVSGMLAPLFRIYSLLILDLSTLALPSNPISKLTYYLLQALLAPNYSIRALLIRHFQFSC